MEKFLTNVYCNFLTDVRSVEPSIEKCLVDAAYDVILKTLKNEGPINRL